MAVAIDTSTNGKYGMFSSENATLATALAEVLDELETQNKSETKTNMMLTYDAGNSKYAFVAICKN